MMTSRIVRSLAFTTCMGRVLNADKESVSGFLGSSKHEEELSRLGHEADHKVLPFLRSITPEGQLIQLYKGPSGYGGGCEECVLAQVEAVF